MKMIWLCMLTILGMIGMAFGQDTATQVVAEPPLSYDVFLGYLFASIGGLKGVGTLATVVGVAQILLKLLQTTAGELVSKYKLLAVSLLTVVVGTASMMMAGEISFFSALIHSSNLASVQVFLHQIYKQFIKKEA